MEHRFSFRKRKYSSNIKKTKEQQEKELMGLPRNIGPYELIEKINDGGYSKIYKAKSCYTGDFVAIKTIDKLGFQESVEDVLLMVRQTEVLKILKHRNIVNLYEIYESKKFFYLIMEYLPNGDLIEQIIKKKRFQEKEALVIFSQLVDALYYMHKNEICHRDIRTEKILFDKKNKPKLIGFSYSSFYTLDKKIKDSYGSLCYACPEIIQNDYYNPELADVWSLGVVLYVMVCGYLPFSEDDDNENKDLIIKGNIDYPPQISNKVKDLLKHMLDINPHKRYTFQKIIRHPWFKPFNEATLTGGCNTYKMIYPVDERILKLIVIYGFNKKEVDKDLKQNSFNIRTGLYKQLSDKMLIMGFTSFSDLCSEDFMNFSKDKENMISDGDKKYKKYINKILERISKVERYVKDYKRKEDKIVKDLENIYDKSIEEGLKNDKRKKIINSYRNKNINNGNFFENKIMNQNEACNEQKENKNIFKKNQEITNKNELDEDYDMLKAFNENNKKKNGYKNSTILIKENKDLEINQNEIKRSNSTPNKKDFISKLIEKDDKSSDLYEYNNEFYQKNSNEIKNPVRKRLSSMMIRRKKRNYLNGGSENDYFLKRPKDNSERKKIIEKNCKKGIKPTIIEENINEEKDKEEQNNEFKENANNFELDNFDEKIINNNTDEQKEIKIGQNLRKKSLRFSLSFGDDDEELVEDLEEENNDYNASINISKIGSKSPSMYNIEKELNELKEMKNNLQSPIRSSYLKRNINDNNLYNFNMERNSSIFGEHLEDDVSRKNSNFSLLESINEKYDLLTELKNLNEKINTKKKISKNLENTEIKEFNNDTLIESIYEDKKEKNKEKIKDNNNPFFLDDNLEISFHDDKNGINIENKNNIKNLDSNIISTHNNEKENRYKLENKIFRNDTKKISKLNLFNHLENVLLNILNIDLKRKKQYIYKFLNDKNLIKKVNIPNDNINIIEINSKFRRDHNYNVKKYEIQKVKLNSKSKNENKVIYNDKNIFKLKSENKNRKKQKNNKNNSFINKSENNDFIRKNTNEINLNIINNLLTDKNNNGKTFKKSASNEIKQINNKNINNNIIINSNNNITNNISIKYKNIYTNYCQNFSIYKENSINSENTKKQKLTKIKYAAFINHSNISKLKNKSIDSLFKKSKNSNNFKSNKNLDSYLHVSEKLKSNKKPKSFFITFNESSLDNKTYKVNKNNIYFFDIKNKNNNDKDFEIKKNLNIKFKDIIVPLKRKNKKMNFSYEKVFHYNIMKEEFEKEDNPEKMIAKIKKLKRKKKLLDIKMINKNKDTKFLDKFVNKKPSNFTNAKKANYLELYLKNQCLNNNKNNYDYDDENL